MTSCCEKKRPDPEDAMVAKVGNHVITVRDFRRNYEFGLPHLKKGPNKKRSYLDYMIKEQILAQQGYKLNLDKSEAVRKKEQELMDELLVEALFDNEVKSKIEVSDEEIRDAMNRSHVQWKMRYWFEPDKENAELICQAMRESGYADVLEKILQVNPELNLKPEDFESKYLTWLEVNPDLLEVIKDLPRGEISDPVEMGGGYFIIQVVDIRREAIREYDYQEKAESFRQILFYRKLTKETGKYVSGLMTPKNVVTKGDAFRKLSNALEQWRGLDSDKREDFLTSVLSAQSSDGSLYDLKAELDQILVSFEGGSWTIKDFLDRFDPRSIKVNKDKGRTAFRSALNNQIALEVRDDFMTKEARKKDLYKSPRVLKELQMWKDKWVYQEVRHYYTHDLQIDEKQTREYFEKYKDRFKIRWNDEPKFDEYHNQSKRLAYIEKARNLLALKADSLANTAFPVSINRAVLDTITTIEFQKSPWASLQVFKSSSKRLSCPIVDPAWGF